MNNDRILITSALPYASVKHLGNLAGSLLPADVYARFQRLQGRNVLFVCGVDCHGTPAELAAAAVGVPVADYCADQHKTQADIYRRFSLSFDHFGATSCQANADLTCDLFRRLDEAGFIEARSIRQIWSPADQRFLPDRYVVGTCPLCGYVSARGDQCDGCGRLLDPTDLVSPRSAISGATDLEEREERHLFLLQSKLASRLRDWIEGPGEWEPLTKSIALKWLDEGLGDRCITRNLAWGIPVPKAGFEHLKFYVWFDAPIGYLAFVKEWADAHGQDWRDWLKKGPGRRFVQVLGKDNASFHTVNFPATIVGSGADIRLVDRIKCLNWLNYGGQKFSTSEKRGVFTDAALDEFPSDVWRWWLTANAPEGDDVSFSFPLFATGVNADLADNLGNLVSRVTKFTTAKFEGFVPTGGEPGPRETDVVDRAHALVASCTENLDAFRLRKACGDIRALWSLGNEYFANQQPWTVLKTDPERAACITRTALNLVALAAGVAAPVIPKTSALILDALGLEVTGRWPDADAFLTLSGGRRVVTPDVLFPKIAVERVGELEERFGFVAA